ncbi:hypothetical protein [Streptomyces sp. BRA346]|uniref:hypothetical protein n=1 Tax=Streptomyces sp. BRA346 TaxID=2878199 RepID=UPI0040627D24
MATSLVKKAEWTPATAPVEQITPDQVATLAFGRYQVRITPTEAAEYLAAALVARGHSITHLSSLFALFEDVPEDASADAPTAIETRPGSC